MATKKDKNEKEAERLALDLAEKLENNEISVEAMMEEIDKFLTNQR